MPVSSQGWASAVGMKALKFGEACTTPIPKSRFLLKRGGNSWREIGNAAASAGKGAGVTIADHDLWLGDELPTHRADVVIHRENTGIFVADQITPATEEVDVGTDGLARSPSQAPRKAPRKLLF